MLNQIDTGYEGKFDFAQRLEGPALTYLLASVPRREVRTSVICCGAPVASARRSNI